MFIPTTSYRIYPLGYTGSLIGTCNIGQLTNRGIIKHQTLGKNLRAKYVEELNLISANDLCVNDPNNYVYVRSTDIPRTIQSVQSNMLTFQGCAINKIVNIAISQGIDTLLTSTLPYICPYLTSHNFFTSGNAQEIFTQYSGLLTQAQVIFQNPDLDFLDLVELGDPLNCRLCHNDTYPLPAPLDFMLNVNTFFSQVLESAYAFNSSMFASPFMWDILDDWVAYVQAPSSNPLGAKYSVFFST